MLIDLMGGGGEYNCGPNVIKIIKAKFPECEKSTRDSPRIYTQIVYKYCRHHVIHLTSNAQNSIFEEFLL